MSDSGSLEALVERLLARVRELESVVAQQRRVIAEQTDRRAKQADRIVELERRLGRDSSTSSRPPSSDAPWDKQPAKKRSSRGQSGRKPGKQPGSVSASRSVVDDPDETFEVAPDHCARCAESLDGAAETARVRRQVVDVPPPPPPKVTEYQLVSRRCGGCGHVNDPTATDVPRPMDPGSDVARPAAGVLHADETTGRAAGALAYVHVACTEYLTLMHVGGRSSDDIDAGGVLPEFTGTLMRDGYAGYQHLPAVHAWCAAHLLRDLRALSDADPLGQLWAKAMADTLLEANQAAHQARNVSIHGSG